MLHLQHNGARHGQANQVLLAKGAGPAQKGIASCPSNAAPLKFNIRRGIAGAEGSMPFSKITKSSVEAIKLATVDQYLLDRALKGFGVNCTPWPPVLPSPYQLRGRIGRSAQPAPVAA